MIVCIGSSSLEEIKPIKLAPFKNITYYIVNQANIKSKKIEYKSSHIAKVSNALHCNNKF